MIPGRGQHQPKTLKQHLILIGIGLMMGTTMGILLNMFIEWVLGMVN